MTSPNLYPLFGRRLSAARKAKGLTQAQVAAEVQLSRASVANVEAGKQRVFLDQVYGFAAALGLDSPDDLLPEFVQKVAGQPATLKIMGATNLSKEQEQSLREVLRKATKK